MKSLFNYAISNYGLTYNPVLQRGNFKTKQTIVKDEEKLRYITKEEFDKFISVVDIPLWHCFFITLYYTGARKGELLALKWTDIDFDNKEISINKTLNTKLKGRIDITPTKNYLNRKIKMSKTLYEELYSYYLDQKKYTDFSKDWYVFNGTTYLPLTTIDRYKHKYFVKSGVPEITIHEFRHSHVSLLINEYLKSGQTDTTKFFLMMSNRMGHSIGVMQKCYLHLFPTVQDEIVDLLDNL
jgi:integrase